MKLRREKKFKECPRCGLRCPINADSCTECGLVFSRLDFATNADAKAKIKRKEKEYILYVSQLPSDVSFIKLLLLCIFGGLFGAHSFYVGRVWRGIIPLTVTLILTGFTIFNAEMIAIDGTGTLLGAISTALGFVMFMWPLDIVLIFTKKFKVPVAIDLDKPTVHLANDESIENQLLKAEILNDVKQIKEETEEESKKDKNEV
ncbi:MAG: NINE protein [Clostridiales bacterium]|nr:NINE protein [Clostridiales bacterium]